MDVYLEENAPELIQAVKEAIESYGNDDAAAEYCAKEPIYAVLGMFATSSIENYYDDNKYEIEAVIDFANRYDVDITEWNLEDNSDRLSFALMYLSIQMESELAIA